MKIAALITVAALTCGTALAQGYGSSSTDRNTSASPNSAAVSNDSQPKGEGFIDKTKRAFHNLGQKLRGAGTTAKNSTDKDSDKAAQQNPDTRSMGAGKADSSRQSRMDDAYTNSKKAKPAEK